MGQTQTKVEHLDELTTDMKTTTINEQTKLSKKQQEHLNSYLRTVKVYS